MTTVLCSFGVQIFVFGVSAGVIFVTRSYGTLWIGTLAFLLLAAFSFAVYVVTLRKIDRIATSHQETMISELCKA